MSTEIDFQHKGETADTPARVYIGSALQLGIAQRSSWIRSDDYEACRGVAQIMFRASDTTTCAHAWICRSAHTDPYEQRFILTTVQAKDTLGSQSTHHYEQRFILKQKL